MRRGRDDEDLMLDEVYDFDELHRRYEPAQGDPAEALRFQFAAQEFDRLWHQAQARGCQRALLN